MLNIDYFGMIPHLLRKATSIIASIPVFCACHEIPPKSSLFYPDDPDDPGLVSRWRDMGYLSVEQLLPLVELLDAPAKPSSSQSQSQGEMQVG